MKRLLVLVALVLLTCATANAAEVLCYGDYGNGLYVTTLDGALLGHYTDAQLGMDGTTYAVGRGPNGGVLVGNYGFPGTYKEINVTDGTIMNSYIYSVNTAGGADSLAGGAIYATNLQGTNAYSILGGVNITDSQVVTPGNTGAFPQGLAINRATGDIYLSVAMQHNGSSYTPGALWKTSVSAWGSNPTLLYSAGENLGGVAIDPSGNVWVGIQADGPYTGSIVKLDSAGAVVQTISIGSGYANWPMGLSFDSAGNLYTNMNYGNKIRKYFAAGGYTTFADIGTTTNAGYLVIIPEPATMVLLGLGALTMLRRKK